MVTKSRTLKSTFFVGCLLLAAPAVAAPKPPVIKCPEIASGDYKCIEAKTGTFMPVEYIQAKDEAGNDAFQVNLDGNIGKPMTCTNITAVTKSCTPDERKQSATKAAECQKNFGPSVFTVTEKTVVRPDGLNVVRNMVAGNKMGVSTLAIKKDKVQPDVINISIGLKRGSQVNQASKFVCFKSKGKK